MEGAGADIGGRLQGYAVTPTSTTRKSHRSIYSSL